MSGGGDAPGINAVIRAVVRKGIQNYGYEIVGIKDGWLGLLENDYVPLDLKSASGILPRGGSILGTSRTNPFKREKDAETVLKNAKKAGISAVVAIGGDDTLSVAYKMGELKIRELRRFSEQQLMEKFDIREFHRIVLQNGCIPLNILENTVNKWISDFQSRINSL